MPVYQMQQEMPYDELLKWIEFFRRRPPGWQEDQRTMFLMMSMGAKKKDVENLFPALNAVKEAADKREHHGRAVPKGKFLEMMARAKGGDKGVNILGGVKK